MFLVGAFSLMGLLEEDILKKKLEEKIVKR